MKTQTPEIALPLPVEALEKLKLLVHLKLLDIHTLLQNKQTAAGLLPGSDLDF